MTSARINPDRQMHLDMLQVVAVILLMVLSVAFVYSATTSGDSVVAVTWYHQRAFRQIVFFVLGIGAASLVCTVDYHVIARWAYVAYWLAIVSLVVVLFVGTTRYGAKRWVEAAGFQLQPSEFAKLAFILAQAHFLSRPVDELRLSANFWRSIGLMALPFLLIMKEPDLGSALVLVPTGLAMLFVAGTPRQYLLQLIGMGGVLAALFLADVLLAPPSLRIINKVHDYQIRRLLVYFGRDYASYAGKDVSDAEKATLREQEFNDSHNVRQAMIAVGAGGLTGEGWRHGQQNELGFLPEAGKHNDFIFAVIAEELGFVGSFTVLVLYSVVLFTGIRIAGQARDRLGKLLAVGVVTLLFSHVFINIGMNIRLMPVTGVPLPLLSYGGSSVLGSLIAIGMLQNVHMYRKAY
jgi:rod shape determining protein RodA